MTKSNRSKKKRQADFQKPKIKLGKKLKKPLNETKTDFKIKKIILKDQLPEKENALLSKKNTPIKEVLSHMTHHSVSIRQDALSKLKSIVEMNPEKDLLLHLSSIVHAVSASTCDTDRQIRATAFKIIEAIIVKMNANFDPYFPVLASHLTCAMVSMNRAIQMDSFTLMNILIKERPALLMKHSRSLLPKFLSMIAIKVSQGPGDGRKDSSKQSYVFNFSPGSSTNSLKNRIKILKTLSLYLEALVKAETKSDARTPSCTWQIIVEGSLPSAPEVLSHLGNPPGLLQGGKEVESFFASLSPLLSHTWLEVQSPNSDEDNHLSHTSQEIIGCIIRVILQISKISKYTDENASIGADWSKEHLETPIMKILKGFPYVSSTSSKDANEKTDFSIHDLNIGLALISFEMFEDRSKIKLKLAQYLIELLESDSFDGQYKVEEAVALMSYLVAGKDAISPELSNEILLASLACFRRSPPKTKQLFKPLFIFVLESQCRDLWRLESFGKWIEGILCEIESRPNNGSLQEILLQLKLRNNPTFVSILERRGQTKRCAQE